MVGKRPVAPGGGLFGGQNSIEIGDNDVNSWNEKPSQGIIVFGATRAVEQGLIGEISGKGPSLSFFHEEFKA